MLENILIIKCPDCGCEEITNEGWHSTIKYSNETRGWACGYLLTYERSDGEVGQLTRTSECRRSDFYKERKIRRLDLIEFLIAATKRSTFVDEIFKNQIISRLSSMKLNT